MLERVNGGRFGMRQLYGMFILLSLPIEMISFMSLQGADNAKNGATQLPISRSMEHYLAAEVRISQLIQATQASENALEAEDKYKAMRKAERLKRRFVKAEKKEKQVGKSRSSSSEKTPLTDYSQSSSSKSEEDLKRKAATKPMPPAFKPINHTVDKERQIILRHVSATMQLQNRSHSDISLDVLRGQLDYLRSVNPIAKQKSKSDETSNKKRLRGFDWSFQRMQKNEHKDESQPAEPKLKPRQIRSEPSILDLNDADRKQEQALVDKTYQDSLMVLPGVPDLLEKIELPPQLPTTPLSIIIKDNHGLQAPPTTMPLSSASEQSIQDIAEPRESPVTPALIEIDQSTLSSQMLPPNASVDSQGIPRKKSNCPCM